MAVLYTQHFMQFFDDDGEPLSGGKLYAFEAGTGTSGVIDGTPKNMFTDAGAGTPTANPLLLDSAGRGVAFISGSYKFGLTDSSNNIISVVDNVNSFLAGDDTVSINDFSALTTVTPASADLFIFSDNDDSGASKTVSYSDLQSAFSGGSVLQIEEASTTALVSGTTTMPYDDTIPQITEGFEVLTQSITPQDASSTLYIDFWCSFNVSTAGQVICAAMFVDSTANALAATAVGSGSATGDTPGTFVFRHSVASGNTSARTYKVRIGRAGGSITVYVNGDNTGTRVYGGVASTGLRITEVSA